VRSWRGRDSGVTQIKRGLGKAVIVGSVIVGVTASKGEGLIKMEYEYFFAEV
jgi:hypothetical protein